MGFRTICVALMLSSLPIAGCGTAANVVRSRPEEGGRLPFGGVQQDLWCMKKAATGEYGSKPHTKSDSEQYPQMVLMLFCAMDLPFSFVGDVVTWPYTAAFTFINQPVPVPPVTIINTPVTQAGTNPYGTQPMPLPTPYGTPPMPPPIPPGAQPLPLPNPLPVPPAAPPMLPSVPPVTQRVPIPAPPGTEPFPLPFPTPPATQPTTASQPKTFP